MNSFPGEFPQPLVRSAHLLFPMVSGYTTGRLRAQTQLAASGTDQLTQFTFENVGETAFTLQLKEVDDRVSGTRSNLGNTLALVVGGHATVNLTPTKKFLEIACTTGNGELRLQVASTVRWDVLAFAKDDVLYPRSLWAPTFTGQAIPDIPYP